MASIQLKNIWKIYPGNVTAVHDFNLDIAHGEFVVLVGPSGCGKSTTLRMIAGLEEITEGELFIADRLVNDVPPKDRDIAMVFQNYALYPHMTVFKNMSFGLTLRKMPKDEIKRRVYDAARILDIEHLLGRKPKALSGGQRQRVALGRAMVRDPAVFLLDEPLSNLDAKLRASMRTELIKLHQKLGSTFVYVTHDQVEAMTMGDRIIVMNNGFIQQADTPQTLYQKPCNMFVAGFIGTPQINFLDAVLKKEADGYYAVLGQDRWRLDSSRAGALTAYENKPVKLGVRPEDLHDDDAFIAANPHALLSARVEVRELLGSETYLYLDYQGAPVIARVAPKTSSRVGETIRAAVDTAKIHLFDPETEQAID